MIRFGKPLVLLATLVACSEPPREPEQGDAGATSATAVPPRSTAIASSIPHRALPAGRHAYAGAGGLVLLTYEDPLKPSGRFVGGALLTQGWRLMWDGKEAGPGTAVVSVAEDARAATGIGIVTEFVQVGMSRDAGVVTACGTAGMATGIAQRQPNRQLGGHRWTVWKAGDAGMNQEVDATDWRTVVDGVCYAIDRVSYSVKAADAKPGMPTQAAPAARIDAALASIRVGGR